MPDLLLSSPAVLQHIGKGREDKPGVFAYSDLPGPLSRGTMKLGTIPKSLVSTNAVAALRAFAGYSTDSPVLVRGFELRPSLGKP